MSFKNKKYMNKKTIKRNSLKTADSLFIFRSFSESSDVSVESRFSPLGKSFILYLQWYPESTDQGGHQFLGLQEENSEYWTLTCLGFFFGLLHSAYGILVPQLGIQPTHAPAVEVQILNYWTAREISNIDFFISECLENIVEFFWISIYSSLNTYLMRTMLFE